MRPQLIQLTKPAASHSSPFLQTVSRKSQASKLDILTIILACGPKRQTCRCPRSILARRIDHICQWPFPNSASKLAWLSSSAAIYSSKLCLQADNLFKNGPTYCNKTTLGARFLFVLAYVRKRHGTPGLNLRSLHDLRAVRTRPPPARAEQLTAIQV